MSRIGRKPIPIPAGVDVTVEGRTVSVRGPKGRLSMSVHADMAVRVEGGNVLVERPSEQKLHKALHGLTRSLVNNMVVGVSEGFSKTLEIAGIGYKAQKSGSKVVLSLGLSHPVEVEEPAGISIEVPAPNRLVVRGCDKQLVGETAAKIRALRVPDAYQGKGIKYEGQVLRLKEGKTGGKGK